MGELTCILRGFVLEIRREDDDCGYKIQQRKNLSHRHVCLAAEREEEIHWEMPVRESNFLLKYLSYKFVSWLSDHVYARVNTASLCATRSHEKIQPKKRLVVFWISCFRWVCRVCVPQSLKGIARESTFISLLASSYFGTSILRGMFPFGVLGNDEP